MILEMKNLVKAGLIFFSIIAFAGCQKTELIPVSDASSTSTGNFKHYEAISDIVDGASFTDKDKCKKCHTGKGKSMGINWEAPYMSDNRYNTIEELINDFDFINNVHRTTLNLNEKDAPEITDEQKQELIDYLKSLVEEEKLFK
jgi:hypothetical protein